MAMHGKALLFAFLPLAAASALACGSSKNSITFDGGTHTTSTCDKPATVEDQSQKDCAACTSMQSCTTQAPVEACCTWMGPPNQPVSRATGLHRYSAPAGSTSPDLGCLAGTPTPLGSPQTVTLTGYVWLFSSGVDSGGLMAGDGVKVEVFTENAPNTDGSISSSALGSFTTTNDDATDPPDPVDTTWNSKCPTGCKYRRYTIANVPTETPLVIKTSDAGGGGWATVYDYNIYFSNASVTQGDGGGPTVSYDATAAAGPDLTAVAGAVGLSVDSGQGLLAGEVHDCGDVRLEGATVGTTVTTTGQLFYFTSDESNPLPSDSGKSTSVLGLYGGINLPTGKPVRVSAVGEDPSNPGKLLMLGSYVVQLYPGAVTALSLRGRRPWQP